MVNFEILPLKLCFVFQMNLSTPTQKIVASFLGLRSST